MTIYAKIITLAAVLVALAVGAQAQTPEIDALRARAEQRDAETQWCSQRQENGVARHLLTVPVRIQTGVRGLTDAVNRGLRRAGGVIRLTDER